MNDTIALFGIQIHRMDLKQAVDQLYTWFGEEQDACRYVVTPNVDHVVMLQHHAGLRESYQGASLILADGKPIVAAARLFRRPLPGTVAGSDLIPALLAAASPARPLRVFLLGAMPGVGERAIQQIQRRWPDVTTVGCYSPPLGFEKNDAENANILAMIEQASPDLLVVGVGAPKQELWVANHSQQLKAKVAVCAGATIDFLAGEKRRAPRWLQRLSLEWFHRMCSEPSRLLPRYARDAWYFPGILFRQWLAFRRTVN